MGWIRFDTCTLTDEWINELTEAERWAWAVFILYAGTNTPRWLVKITAYKIICRILGITEETFALMLSKAIEGGKVMETEDGFWLIANGHKYDNDPTAKERVARYRKKKQERYSNERNVTDVTLSHLTSPHSTSQSFPNGKEKARFALASSLVSVWNLEKLESWPVCNFESMSAKPKKTLTDRINIASKNEDFDLKQILGKAKESSFLQTAGFFNLLWLVTVSKKYNELNYKQVLNGTYANPSSRPAGKQRDKQLDPEFAKQLAEREDRPIVL